MAAKPMNCGSCPGCSPVGHACHRKRGTSTNRLQSLNPSSGRPCAAAVEMIGFDLSGCDGPQLPDIPESNGGKSRSELLSGLARQEDLTIRQLYLRIAGARGHRQIHGTAAQIADDGGMVHRGALTASTSCRPGCPVAWTISSELVIPNCNVVICSGQNMKPPHCAAIWDFADRRTVSQPAASRQRQPNRSNAHGLRQRSRHQRSHQAVSPDGHVHRKLADIESTFVREFVTIIGASGCGKSTLLRVIAVARSAGRRRYPAMAVLGGSAAPA